jgi:hypothetical protein
MMVMGGAPLPLLSSRHDGDGGNVRKAYFNSMSFFVCENAPASSRAK